jgi:hypothetical protein
VPEEAAAPRRMAAFSQGGRGTSAPVSHRKQAPQANVNEHLTQSIRIAVKCEEEAAAPRRMAAFSHGGKGTSAPAKQPSSTRPFSQSQRTPSAIVKEHLKLSSTSTLRYAAHGGFQPRGKGHVRA